MQAGQRWYLTPQMQHEAGPSARADGLRQGESRDEGHAGEHRDMPGLPKEQQGDGTGNRESDNEKEEGGAGSEFKSTPQTVIPTTTLGAEQGVLQIQDPRLNSGPKTPIQDPQLMSKEGPPTHTTTSRYYHTALL